MHLRYLTCVAKVVVNETPLYYYHYYYYYYYYKR